MIDKQVTSNEVLRARCPLAAGAMYTLYSYKDLFCFFKIIRIGSPADMYSSTLKMYFELRFTIQLYVPVPGAGRYLNLGTTRSRKFIRNSGFGTAV